MTFRKVDQSDQGTFNSWQQKNTMTTTMTKTKKKMTKTNTCREHLQRAILAETCDVWDIRSQWWRDMTWPTERQWQWQRQLQRQISDLWYLRHWLQFWQLRTWIHVNLCYMTIKSDTGNSCNVSHNFPHSLTLVLPLKQNARNTMFWISAVKGNETSRC